MEKRFATIIAITRDKLDEYDDLKPKENFKRFDNSLFQI